MDARRACPNPAMLSADLRASGGMNGWIDAARSAGGEKQAPLPEYQERLAAGTPQFSRALAERSVVLTGRAARIRRDRISTT